MKIMACVALAMGLAPAEVPIQEVALESLDCPSLSRSVRPEALICRGAIGVYAMGTAYVRSGPYMDYAIAHEFVHALQMREGINPMTDAAEQQAIDIGQECGGKE